MQISRSRAVAVLFAAASHPFLSHPLLHPLFSSLAVSRHGETRYTRAHAAARSRRLRGARRAELHFNSIGAHELEAVIPWIGVLSRVFRIRRWSWWTAFCRTDIAHAVIEPCQRSFPVQELALVERTRGFRWSVCWTFGNLHLLLSKIFVAYDLSQCVICFVLLSCCLCAYTLL